MKDLRVNFDFEKVQWFIESPIALSEPMKDRAITFVKPQLISRIRGEQGERKRRMEAALKLLTPKTLEVRFVGKGEKTIYLDKTVKY